MRPLATVVTHLERNAQAYLDAGEGTILLTCKTVLELCRAFRAAEKMRDGCGMAGHNMKPHGDCLVCSAMSAWDAAVRGDVK